MEKGYYCKKKRCYIGKKKAREFCERQQSKKGCKNLVRRNNDGYAERLSTGDIGNPAGYRGNIAERRA